MNAQYLLTPTLIQSWQYWYNYDGENEESVKNSFLSTLKREKIPTNEAMQEGIKFENKIMNVCNNKPQENPQENQCVLDIAEKIQGGIWQVVLKKNIKVSDTNFLLYGKADVIKENTIYDIKFTTNASNYEVGKYTNAVQHLFYMYCSGIEKFKYIISDGENYWLEDYNFTMQTIEAKLFEKIAEFILFLKNNQEFYQIFINKWQTL